MHHDPTGFANGALKGSKLRWPAVNKRTFAVVSRYRRLNATLWKEVVILRDCGYLAYISHLSDSNTAFAGIGHMYRRILVQDMHIPGAWNSRGHLLSRWFKPTRGTSGAGKTGVQYLQVAMKRRYATRQAYRKIRPNGGCW